MLAGLDKKSKFVPAMSTIATYHLNQLRDYSTLFSRAEMSRWIKSDWSGLRTKIERYDGTLLHSSYSYLSYLKKVYRIIERFYPNEYVYKNEFISRWLLEEIGTDQSILFNEFRLGKAVADLAMFNGVSRVFEIKTLLDKESRLGNQLDQYRKLFNEIYLIIPEQKYAQYKKLDTTAGIIIYDKSTSGFSCVRAATKQNDIEADILMEVLHTHEYISIVEQYYGERPTFNDFNKFRVCKQLIQQIPNDLLSKLFVATMKQRRINNAFSRRFPQFNQLFLSLNYTPLQQRQILSNLRTPIN
jgi:hypothetical protein